MVIDSSDSGKTPLAFWRPTQLSSALFGVHSFRTKFHGGAFHSAHFLADHEAVAARNSSNFKCILPKKYRGCQVKAGPSSRDVEDGCT
jgi:hypothetical protein